MSLEILKTESLDLSSQLEQIVRDIAQAESIAVRNPKYTNVSKLQKLKEWRAILQGKLITNQNKQYRLREEKKK